MPGFLDSDLARLIAINYALGGFKNKPKISKEQKKQLKQQAKDLEKQLDDRKKFFDDKTKEFETQDKRTDAVIKHARDFLAR